MPQAPEEFKDWLRACMKREKLSQRKTADLAGFSHPLMTEILKYGKRPSEDTIYKLAALFNANPVTILKLAGYLNKEKGWDAGMEEWIEVGRGLLKPDRDEVLEMARVKLHRYKARENAGSKSRKSGTDS